MEQTPGDEPLRERERERDDPEIVDIAFLRAMRTWRDVRTAQGEAAAAQVEADMAHPWTRHAYMEKFWQRIDENEIRLVPPDDTA